MTQDRLKKNQILPGMSIKEYVESLTFLKPKVVGEEVFITEDYIFHYHPELLNGFLITKDNKCWQCGKIFEADSFRMIMLLIKCKL